MQLLLILIYLELLNDNGYDNFLIVFGEEGML